MAYELVSLNHLATFETKHDLNETVKAYNKELNKQHYETLRLLSQYSLKVLGVSHLKIETIAAKLNKSVRTIKRHIAYLKANGYITVVNTVRRVTGGKGANAYVINTIDYRKKLLRKIKNVTSKMSRRDAGQKDGKTLGAQALAFVKVRKETINSLKLYIKSYSNGKARKRIHTVNRINRLKNVTQCPEHVDVETYKRFKAFFTDAQIVALVKTINTQLDAYDLSHSERLEITNDSIKAVVTALKKYHNGKGQRIHSIYAYAGTTAKRKALYTASANMFDFAF
ncbi:HTH domain-containing protein (plasmid) [Macrococcoides canis]|uniref:HTH domain-containing protein n=1 Tax=Macrococcoides canis TaxID=1855823 RepID=A0AAE6X3W8_9STAP|nr:helix-turn-helix domain-containing protein [Macrococcus canis]QIH79463.1 HTH domain-containing protein [Macrococcus canis]